MSYFTALAEVNDIKQLFTFNGREVPEGKIYSVNILHDGENLANFEARCSKNGCCILPPAPDWVLEQEELVISLIRDHKGC